MIAGKCEQQSAQQAPEVVEDQAEIVSGAAQQGVDRVASRTGEEIAVKATIGLHVTDHRLDGAASPQLACCASRRVTRTIGSAKCGASPGRPASLRPMSRATRPRKVFSRLIS